MEETDPRSGDPLELPNGSSREPLAAEPAAAPHTESAAPLPEHEATESEIEPAEESKEEEIPQEQAEDGSKPSAADAEAKEAPSGEGSRTLPLPYLKVGYLTAPPANNTIAPHKDWERSQFVLNHDGLQQVTGSERHFSESPSNRLHRSTSVDKTLIKVDVADIVSVSACADLTLPPGAGLCMDTIHGPVFLVADTWESLDGWLDAIRLVYTIFARGKSDVLAGVITG